MIQKNEQIVGGGCPRTQFEKNSSSKMAGKTINSENNHVDVMNKDAEICLNSDTLLPGNSVGGVFGQPGGGQFNISGYDASIDYLKGISILWIVMTHCVPTRVQDVMLFPLWGAQAVPVFLIIQVFHAYKKGIDNTTFPIGKIWKRIILPFLLTIGITYIISIGSGLVIHKEIGELTISFLKSGGNGAGSYYFWIYLQFALLLPLISFILKKNSLRSNLIILIIIAESLEVLCCLLAIPEWLYRLLFFRYFFLVYIGYYLVNYSIKLNPIVVIITILSVPILLIFQYGSINFEPLFFNSVWKTQHWITYGYDLFVIYVLVEIYKMTSENRFTQLILLSGKYSYEIFLWQMIYFCMPIKKVFTILFGDALAIVIYIGSSLAICVLPVLYFKNKNDFKVLFD